jgi:hypothetical protein
MKKQVLIKSNSAMKPLILVALIILPLILGCGRLKDNISRNSSSFNPYKGSLSELLRPEISSLSIKFKSKGSRDVAADYPGSTEAKGFTYMQEGAGVEVQVDGALVNYPTAAAAETILTELAGENEGTVTNKGKGKKFTAKKGSLVGWTNGSIMCLVASNFAKPAGNFEEAAPF